jgi:heme oxygenase
VHELGFKILKEHFWPFTSVFSSKHAELLVGLVFLIDGCFNGEQYVSTGAKRLLEIQEFCKTKLHGQYKNEKQFWQEFVDRLEVFDDKNHGLKSIINSTKVL